MILGPDGERLSKRHGAVSVMQYQEDGFLPEALVNYLARLGWSHGDEEKFSRDQLVEWFDLEHISKSPARFDPEKLTWLNAQYLKEAGRRAAGRARAAVPARPEARRDERRRRSRDVVALLKERASTLKELADAAVYFYRRRRRAGRARAPAPDRRRASPRCASCATRFARNRLGPRAKINETIKAVVAEHKLKLPKIAMPLRVMVTGTTHTPSIDATLELIGKDAGARAHGPASAAFRGLAV